MTPDFEAQKQDNEARIFEDEVQGREVPTGLPRWIGLTTTTVCNLKCVFCLQADGLAKPRWMSDDVFGHTARELFPTARVVQLSTFGEPFMTPRLHELLDVLEWYGVKLDVVTNGTLLGDDAFMRRTVDIGDAFAFSIDGATASTFNALRINADFDEVMDAIIRWNRFRLLKPANERPRMTFKSILMKDTIREAPALVEIAKAFRADEIGFCHLSEHREEVRGQSLYTRPRESNHYLGLAREKADAYGIPMEGPEPFPVTEDASDEVDEWPEPTRPSDDLLDRIRAGIPDGCDDGGIDDSRWPRVLPALPSGNPRCYFLWRRTYVDPDGHVITCCHPDGERMGNLKDAPFWRIWTSPRYAEFRRRVYSSSPVAICDNCFIINHSGRRKQVYDTGTHNERSTSQS